MIRILDRVSLAFINILSTGKLGAWHDINSRLGHNLPAVDFFVQVACQVINLILPQVSQGTEEAGLVTIEGGVAYGGLRLVGVAGKAAAKGRCNACQHPGTAIPCLNVFRHKGGNFQVEAAAILQEGHRNGFQLADSVVN